ncbi:hypothetical protein [Streptomyces bottropensis]|uniref:hypothetical protein n=1 Tax=Streptomyces bottropensis TaxID=42235 RepID=UPI003678F55D
MKKKSSSTVKAAQAQIQRDTAKNKAKPTPTTTQGSLVDRHIRQHTPDSLYGENAEG